MKKLIPFTLMFTASLAFAQDAAPAQPAKPDAQARANLLAQAGGLVREPASGPAFLFLNMQTRVAPDAIAIVQQELEKVLRFAFTTETKKATSKPLDDAAAAVKDAARVAAAIVICDAPALPPVLIAPESRWAIVNVAALAADKPKGDALAIRTRKELWRTFTYLMGAANSSFEHCLMKTVTSLSDLDALKETVVSPEPFGQVMLHAQKLGMKSLRTSTYKKACEEGWAPAPTNDIQKAIWDAAKK
ncbi:MAG: hypothetical protein FWG50_03565 [Kiritimatiellaeota bacterium]|nr:hypothetical protein [Kiritimatiellota bacterium]